MKNYSLINQIRHNINEGSKTNISTRESCVVSRLFLNRIITKLRMRMDDVCKWLSCNDIC